ncbi:universal stress protein [Shouchella shacheensis]|uniref:universal stress protein n=1 Tax=Shouchella shacheensis TaxID=1649580 RepID=UPI00073FEC2F|nr:universal stress protein [Shouchella shacheensis]
MFQKILLATDGSEHAKRALEKAVEMVGPYRHQVHIDLVYCIDGETSKGDILKYGDVGVADLKRKEMLADNSEFLTTKGVQADSIFLHGEPAKAILKHLKAHSYDCVVVGSRGRNELQTLILGSVSHKLAKYVDIPLLIVK